jgi:hypothetical protein
MQRTAAASRPPLILSQSAARTADLMTLELLLAVEDGALLFGQRRRRRVGSRPIIQINHCQTHFGFLVPSSSVFMPSSKLFQRRHSPRRSFRRDRLRDGSPWSASALRKCTCSICSKSADSTIRSQKVLAPKSQSLANAPALILVKTPASPLRVSLDDRPQLIHQRNERERRPR